MEYTHPLKIKLSQPNDTWSFPGYHFRPAAVIILIVPAGPEKLNHVTLIRRTTSVSSHKGQICFPGGRKEASDRNPKETALRELEEELGIPRDKVTIYGQLPICHSIDGSPIVPIVGATDLAPEKFSGCPREVASFFIVPLPLLRRASSKSFSFKMFGSSRRSHLFEINGNRIWGLTAQIIYSANIT